MFSKLIHNIRMSTGNTNLIFNEIEQNRRFKFLFILLLSLGVLAAAPVGSERFNANPGGTLTVHCKSGGSLEIEGWDQQVIEVQYEDSANDLEDWDIQFKPSDEGLEISSKLLSDSQQTSLSFKIRVPSNYNLRFDSIGGSLTLKHLEGHFRGKTAGGSLTFQDVKGSVRIKSGGGKVWVEECELDGKITTGGGKVWVTNVVGDVDVQSGGGNISYKNVRDRFGELRTPSGETVSGISEDTVLIDSAGGSVRVKEAPHGALVRTGGGNITIHRAQYFVKAETGGGDIDIDLNSGFVSAQTGAGDIDVRFSGEADLSESSTISSGYGDITVFVDADMELTLDLELKVSHNSDRNYNILSDIPVQVEDEGRKDRWGDGPTKYLKGTSPDNGGHRLKIRTTNGNIIVRTK